MKPETRRQWGTKFGFYMAAIGSAFGLGNLWRFPYVVAENGGGAFVLLYLLIAFFVGLPLMLAELMLGKTARKSLFSAVVDLSRFSVTKNKMYYALPAIGLLSLIVCCCVLAYYTVISGWVLYYFMQFFTEMLGVAPVDPVLDLQRLRNNGWLQIMLASCHLIVVVVVVAKDIEKGIERWVGYMMPVFAVLLTLLMLKASSLATTGDALRFVFYPDFSSLSFASLSQALGHVFFTLSIGFGAMVTFGSYLQEKAYIPETGFRVVFLDTLLSIIGVTLIFLLLFAVTLQGSGPELLFQTVPLLLQKIQWGSLYGCMFFLCLYLAALNASIGILETVVADLLESKKLNQSGLNRQKISWLVGSLCLILTIFPALSTTALSVLEVQGKGLIEIADNVLINWILPLVALCTSQVVIYFLQEKSLRDEFIHPELPTSERLYRHWKFLLKYVVPSIILFALGLQLLSF